MSHYFVELALWMLAVFFLGCLIGWLLRRSFGAAAQVHAPAEAAAPMAMAAPPSTPLPQRTQSAPRASAFSATGKTMPVGLPAPRSGRADDLKRISGVGEKYERTLNALGFYHFDQIAQWTAAETEWMDDYLQFNGRIQRENWIGQCQLLAAGDEQEFARLYGTGGLRNTQGQTESGLNTRRN
jgi:predicted flap endonuclease-1-like 5' DNA nuclease